MTMTAMDEVAAALDACRALDMSPERVGRTLGPSRAALLDLSAHSERVNEHDMRMLARKLRIAALLFRLERDCQEERHMD